VLIDGAPQPANFKCLSGYVVQDDVVMGTLTVRENLRFSAALRLPRAVPAAEREARVSHLIQELGLAKVADAKVGTQMIRGISGGERKRTAMGMELIMDPSPRYTIYKQFDSLTLLVGGRMVYHGASANALNYFANIGYSCEPHNNPADFFLDVINGDYSTSALATLHSDEEVDVDALSGCRQSVEQRLVQEYQASGCRGETRAELEGIVLAKQHVAARVVAVAGPMTYNSSFCHQLHWVLRRTFRNLMFNPQTSVAQDDQSGIQNRMGALFFITTNQCFGTVSSAELFITERKLFMHEYLSGYYRVSAYFLSKVLSELIVLRTVLSAAFSLVVYFLIGLKGSMEAFCVFTLTVTLTSYTATAMTMAISADQSVVALANLFITICFVFMMIFSGLLVNLPSVMDWLAWLKYLSIPHYGLAALQINEFVGLQFCNISSLGNYSVKTVGLTCTGEQFLDYQGIESGSWGLWQNHLALAVMAALFLIIAYLKLRFIQKFT
ncbi:hypothetical protein CRUP_038846, partial [Coryphaenoides rupestris]